jgi:UDP-N-acetylmuramate dehydrogenase
MDLPVELLSIPHRRDVAFSRLTTVGLGGVCKWLFEPANERDAQLFVKICRKSGLCYKLLGGGSNLLVLSDIEAPVMRLGMTRELHITAHGIYANACYRHMALVRSVAQLGLSGIEWACGIPGSFGGAIRMNAGSYGGEWGDVLNRVRFILPDGEVAEKKVEPGDFSYRSSFLVDGYVALGASFNLAKGNAEKIKNETQRYQTRRNSSQPRGRSAGCVFKNPAGKSAGQLIESAGLKGLRIGNAQVSPVHGNFFVNLGGATAGDYWELIQQVRFRVSEMHNCDLELEVEVWH